MARLELPTLPAGFVLDGDTEEQPQREAMPALPSGFVLDSTASVTAPVAATEEPEGLPRLTKEPLKAIARSGGQFASDLFDAFSHPIQTGKAFVDLASGTAQKLNPVRQAAVKLGVIDESAGEETVNALKDFMVERYGSVDSALTTIDTDPVGFLSDASIFLTGGGTAVSKAGQVGKLGRLARTGQTIAKAGHFIDPLEATARAGGKVIQSASTARRVGVAPGKVNRAAVQAAQELGVDLPASAKSTAKITPILESLTAKGFFGKKVVERFSQARDKLSQVADDLVSKTGKADDMTSAGKAMSEGVDNFRKRFFEVKNELYKKADFSKRGKDVPVVSPRTIEFVKEVLDQKQGAIRTTGVAADVPFFENLLNRLSRRSADGRFLPKMNAADLHSGVMELEKKIGNINDPVVTGNKAVLNKIATLLDQDLSAAVKASNPELAKDISRADRFFALSLDELNSVFGKKIVDLADKGQYDKVMHAVINKSTSAEDVKRIYRLVGRDNVPQVQAAFLEEFFTGAKNADGHFTPAGLSKQIKRFGEDKLARIVTPDQFKTITQLDELARGIGKFDSIAKGSQTGFLMRTLALGGAFSVNPAHFVKLLLADLGLSLGVGSDLGQKVLSEGAKVKRFGPGVRAGKTIQTVAPQAGTTGRVLRSGTVLNRESD
ncbi:MAG: hypothetical protein DRJ03_03505 [Chloroflexi bacterium]|nr:MAG: hypothetical protein DRJ03_03505 [Chloroflexota bacterium]